MKKLPRIKHADATEEMPPPQPKTVRPYMRESIAALIQRAKEESAIKRSERMAKQKQTVSKFRAEANYEVLIKAWLESVPPSARQRRYRMSEFLLAFEGRYCDRPAPRLIAAALRANAWTEHRGWRKIDRNSRYWKPPNQ